MLFNSIEYLIFLPLIYIFYWALSKRLFSQNLLLLISSYAFYAWWDWRFLSLIVYSSLIDYYIGNKLDKDSPRKTKKNLLLLSLFSNLGLLGIFKYFNFFSSSFATAMSSIGWKVDDVTLSIILPVGISFYTFQTLSYTIDIYRGNLKPTKNIFNFLTFVSFFPQLVAGPIERASNLIPQIEQKRSFKIEDFKDGLFQIMIGLFRKIVIADNLAIYVDQIYSDVELYNSSTLLLATILYAFQIYFDFSGYSDIAIGSAKILGFKFKRNFNKPYFSNSLTEFWRKWHISLSLWLKDYLYISLGGNRKGKLLTYRNLMITMLLGGLWHGSSWNFVIWGGIHGLFLALEKLIFSSYKITNFNYLGNIYTFCIVVFSWIFFRASTLPDSLVVIKGILNLDLAYPYIGNINTLVIGLTMLLTGITFDLFLKISNKSLFTLGSEMKVISFSLSISIIILMLTLFYSTSENFIYFQF